MQAAVQAGSSAGRQQEAGTDSERLVPRHRAALRDPTQQGSTREPETQGSTERPNAARKHKRARDTGQH